MTGVLSSAELDDAALVRKARSSPSIVGRDLVREVVPERSFTRTEGAVDAPIPRSNSSADRSTTTSWPWISA